MTTSNDFCPICGVGSLKHHIGKNRVEYKDKSTELDTQYSVCSDCGSEQANANQLRANKRAMLAFRKKVDGLLTGVEVRDVRVRLGLKQAQAAAIFGGGPVAFSKYESDTVVQSEAMDKLLRVAIAVPDAFAYLSGGVSVEVVKTERWNNVEPMFPGKKPARILSETHLRSEQEWRRYG